MREAELVAIEAGTAIRGVAREADIANSMSAIGGKADVRELPSECLLIAISGNSSAPWRAKLRPSDGCKGDGVPLAVERWYDFHGFGWHLGNVG